MKKTIIKTCSCFFDVALMYLNSDELPTVCGYQLDCYRLCKRKEVFVLQELTSNIYTREGAIVHRNVIISCCVKCVKFQAVLKASL